MGRPRGGWWAGPGAPGGGAGCSKMTAQARQPQCAITDPARRAGVASWRGVNRTGVPVFESGARAGF